MSDRSEWADDDTIRFAEGDEPGNWGLEPIALSRPLSAIRLRQIAGNPFEDD